MRLTLLVRVLFRSLYCALTPIFSVCGRLPFRMMGRTDRRFSKYGMNWMRYACYRTVLWGSSSCDLYANNDVKRQRKRYLSPIKKQEARYGRNKQLFAKILLRTRPCMQAMQHRRQIIMMIKAEHVKEEIHGSFDNAENKWDWFFEDIRRYMMWEWTWFLWSGANKTTNQKLMIFSDVFEPIETEWCSLGLT